MDLSSEYWSVFEKNGNKYADGGGEKDAITLCERHKEEGFTYRSSKMVLNPETVNVNAIVDKQLPGQQGLPQAKERLPFEPEVEQLTQSELQEL